MKTYPGGNKTDKEKQLYDFHRSIRCFSTHPSTSSVSSLPSFLLATPNVPILHDTIWSIPRSLAIHQNNEANLGMGANSTNSTQCISRRLDYNWGQLRTNQAAYNNITSEIGNTWMVDQLQKIEPNSQTINRTPRFLIEYNINDSTTTRKETSRYSPQYSTNIKASSTITEKDSQSNDEDSSSNFCNDSSSIIYATSFEDEEFERLGQGTTTNTRMCQRTTMVEGKHTNLEWKKYSAEHTKSSDICGRQRYGVGMQPSTAWKQTNDSIRTLDTTRKNHVNQLEGTPSSILRITNFPQVKQHEDINSYRQHHLDDIYQQTRRNEVTTIDGTSDNIMEMVLAERKHSPIQPHTRDSEHNSRLRISKTICEEQLDDTTRTLSTNTTDIGS
ncbi:hypothetical protein BDF21DRAFT_464056 [Thamnidium elegans]|nr:hypothetical protein BDF21DRAFT_464056 [Thamnidium elegans]